MTSRVIVIAGNKDVIIKLPTGHYLVPAGRTYDMVLYDLNPIHGIEEVGSFKPHEGRFTEFIMDDHGPSQPRG